MHEVKMNTYTTALCGNTNLEPLHLLISAPLLDKINVAVFTLAHQPSTSKTEIIARAADVLDKAMWPNPNLSHHHLLFRRQAIQFPLAIQITRRAPGHTSEGRRSSHDLHRPLRLCFLRRLYHGTLPLLSVSYCLGNDVRSMSDEDVESEGIVRGRSSLVGAGPEDVRESSAENAVEGQ